MRLKTLPAPSAAIRVLLAAAALLLFSHAPARAQGGWGVVGSCGLERAKGAGSKLTSLVFLDDRRGVIVGDAGLVRLTRNGGVTWSKPQFDPPFVTGITDDVQRVSASGNNLVLVSYKYVLRSRNGGERWSVLRLPTAAEYQKDFGTGLSTYFYDASVVGDDAWVLGAVYDTRGEVLKGSFILHYELDKDHPVPGLRRLDPQEVGTEFLQVFFFDHDAGWVVGTKGGVLMSIDGGKSWRPPVTPLDQTAAARPGGRIGALAADNPPATNPQPTRPAKPKLYGVFFSDRDRGWVVGENAATYYTIDGGESWTQGNVSVANPAKKPTLTQVQFIDENRGWAVGSAGAFLKTVDGGRSWAPEPLPKNLTQSLYAVQMLSESTGWVAGAGDTLLRYDALIPAGDRDGSPKFRERTTGQP